MKRITAATVVSLLLLAGCGGGDEPADTGSEGTPEPTTEPTSEPTTEPTTEPTSGDTAEDPATLIAQSLQALQDEGQVTIAGNVAGVGQIDFDLTDSGLAGALTPPAPDGTQGPGIPVEVIVLEDAGYLRAGADFWTAQGLPKTAIPVYSDQWIQVPPANSLLTVADTFTIDALVKQFGTVPDSATVQEAELNGEPVYVISDPATSSTFTMSADTKLPVEIASAGAEEGSVTLSYDDVTTAEAPAKALTEDDLKKQLQ